MARKFSVIIERDADRYYVASVPALRGCHTQAISLAMRMVVCGIVLLLAAGCAAAAPSTRAECESAGGKWGRFGIRQQELCDLPTADAGKACTDAKDCVSACVAPESAPDGSQAAGKCYGRSLLLGTCLKQVRGGVVGPAICAD